MTGAELVERLRKYWPLDEPYQIRERLYAIVEELGITREMATRVYSVDMGSCEDAADILTAILDASEGAVNTSVRERPILFSGPMVRALLDGTKTQTRRVVKRAHDQVGRAVAHSVHPAAESGWIAWFGAGFGSPEVGADFTRRNYAHGFPCPYGVPGDRLWVRETFAHGKCRSVAYRADGVCGSWVGDGDGGRIFARHGGVIEVPGAPGPSYGLGLYGGRWKPSIHMPRWASRITLELTDVRVQRVQAITTADCRAEGLEYRDPFWLGADHPTKRPPKVFPFAPQAFASLWDSLNGKRGFCWDANPWVWALTFRRCDP